MRLYATVLLTGSGRSGYYRAMYSDGFSITDRLGWAIDWRETTRQRRRDLEDAVVDAAYDNLVDLLLARDDIGLTRPAVSALGNKQLGWRACSAIRVRRLPNGQRRPGPAGAISLEGLAEGMSTGSVRREPPARDDVESMAIRRIAFTEVISAARAGDPTTAAIVLGYAIGFGPDELAEQTGLKANTVTQRKSRFERAHLEDAI